MLYFVRKSMYPCVCSAAGPTALEYQECMSRGVRDQTNQSEVTARFPRTRSSLHGDVRSSGGRMAKPITLKPTGPFLQFEPHTLHQEIS
ncbi:hypothetical protein RRG08_008314 [Elysia crispata]|uniref:Uncharacterized protein n=1 Tax=Elysia crispata TaxID=231223 RepID=A0AAE0ZP85_9GAST|nr:hypothetical protein RRG08_008314 [Elysia crispata]